MSSKPSCSDADLVKIKYTFKGLPFGKKIDALLARLKAAEDCLLEYKTLLEHYRNKYPSETAKYEAWRRSKGEK